MFFDRAIVFIDIAVGDLNGIMVTNLAFGG